MRAHEKIITYIIPLSYLNFYNTTRHKSLLPFLTAFSFSKSQVFLRKVNPHRWIWCNFANSWISKVHSCLGLGCIESFVCKDQLFASFQNTTTVFTIITWMFEKLLIVNTLVVLHPLFFQQTSLKQNDELFWHDLTQHSLIQQTSLIM